MTTYNATTETFDDLPRRLRAVGILRSELGDAVHEGLMTEAQADDAFVTARREILDIQPPVPVDDDLGAAKGLYVALLLTLPLWLVGAAVWRAWGQR